MKDSFSAGIFGILLMMLSSLTGVASGLVTIVSGVVSLVGFDLSGLLGIGLISILVSVVLFLFGLYLVVTNENGTLKFLLGLIGIVLAIVGVLVGLGTSGVGIFFALVLVAIGLAFIGYGFNVDALKPLSGLIKSYKELF